MAKAPHILQADKYAATLEVSFTGRLYDVFQEAKDPGGIACTLRDEGFDIEEPGFILHKSLASYFGSNGRPSQDIHILYRDVNLCPSDGTVILDDEALVKSGLFVRVLRGIGLAGQIREKVLGNYPELPVREALALAGVDPACLGDVRIDKVKRCLDVSIQKRSAAREKKALKDKEAPGETGGPVMDGGDPEPGVEKAASQVQDDPDPMSGAPAMPTGSKEQPAAGDEKTEVLKARLSDEELVATGKFVYVHTGISLLPEIEREIYCEYPDQSIEDGLQKAGLSAEDIGMARVYRIKARFKKLDGRDPRLYKDSSCTEYSEGTAAFYASHPYVESCNGHTTVLNRRFYEEAFFLNGQPVMKTLRIFCIDPGLFTYEQREKIQEDVTGFTEAVIREPSFEEIMNCPPVLAQAYINRMEALEEGIDGLLAELAKELPEMSTEEKRGLFLGIKGLGRDPKGVYTTSYILEKLGVPRSTYYGIVSNEQYGCAAAAKDTQDEEDAALIIQVMEYKGFKKGIWQIYMMMEDIVHVRFGVNKIRRLMHKFGLSSGIREPNEEKRRMREYLKGQVKDNLLQRRFRLYKPGELSLTDVTYLTYGKDRKRAYCSAMIDPVTCKLLAVNVSEKNDLDLVKETLRLASENPMIVGGMVHSDRGCLYLSREFQEEVAKKGLIQSMSRLGNAWDNSPCESYNSNLKQESGYEKCETFEELAAKIEEYGGYYNHERHVKSRLQMTPVQYEEYLLSLSDAEWADYISQKEEEYSKMKAESARKAKEYSKSHGNS